VAYLTRLTLTAFRNYDHLRLHLKPEPVVVTGPNGAGKTNLLEAVSLLGPGRGMRSSKLSEMAAIGRGQPWGVAADLSTPYGERQVGTGAEPHSERRIVKIDGSPRVQGGLAEVASVLWLTPAMDRLFAEPASVRRRFLDRIVYGYDPAHATRVNRYDHALRERQKLLEAQRHPAWLDGIEAVLAETGVAIAAARSRITQRLNKACIREADAFPRPALAMQGEIEDWLAELPALGAEDRFRETLARNRDLDRTTGRCVLGAHRSDLAVVYRDKNMPAAQCSTGEQKSLLIALMLANAGMMAREPNGAPILLLDEIAAHLDHARRTALFERISGLGLQAWMTGTEPETFAAISGSVQMLAVRDGHAVQG
jgi:DNA replication and repair protein RecF